jgi:hypothetical protein
MRNNRKFFGAFLGAVLVLSAGLTGCQRPPTGGGGPVTPTKPATTTIKYGPYTIPAATSAEKMGMIHNNIAANVARPCNNCYITGMQAGLLTAADNQEANVDKGLWLHHMVMFDSSKQDVTCPGVGVGALGQRFFSSGNERTPTKAGGPYGFKQGTNASWTLIYDLMNMNAQAKQVYITVTYDYVPLDTPNMVEITPVWFDINQCSTSERPAKTGQYSYEWGTKASKPGRLIGIGGHLHDGGTNLTLTQNGQLVCDSRATYGGDPKFIEPASSMHMPGMGHISKMSLCQGTRDNPVISFATGDELKITAYYDADAHMQMGTDPIMGIAIGYVDFT